MVDRLPLYIDNPRKPLIDRLLAIFEVLLLSGLPSSSLALFAFHRKSVEFLTNDPETLSAFLLLEAGITLLLLAIILRAHRETVDSLGLQWDRWKANLLIGLALVPCLFLINAIVVSVIRIYLPKYYLEQNPLTEIIHTPQQLVLFIFSALVAGGIKEEIQRAFILTRFGRYLGGAGLGLFFVEYCFWSRALCAGNAGNCYSHNLRLYFWHNLPPKQKPDCTNCSPWHL